jgi:hypothetical protein
MHSAFRELGIDDDATERDVKRAYAARVKVIDVEQDPAAFQALRATYEQALWMARNPHFMQAMVAEGDTDAEESGIEEKNEIAEPAPIVQPIEPAAPIAPIAATAPTARGWDSLGVNALAADEHGSVQDVVTSLYAGLASLTDHGAAHAAVRSARESPQVQSFDAREQFEIDLAAKLCEDTNLHPAVLLGAAESMQWREDMSLLARLRPDIAFNLQRRMQGAALITEWEFMRAQGTSAARLLMGQYRPRYFRYSLIARDCMEHLRALLDASWGAEFEGLRGAPDPRVLAWWRSNIHAPRLTMPGILLSFGTAGAVFVWLATLNDFTSEWMGSAKAWLISGFALLAGVAALGASVGAQLLYAVLQQRYLYRMERNTVFSEGWVVVAPIIAGLCALTHTVLPAWLLAPIAFAAAAWMLFAARIKMTIDVTTYLLFFAGMFSFWIYAALALQSVFLAAAIGTLTFVFIAYMPWRIVQVVEQWPPILRNVYRFGWLALGLALIAGAATAPPLGSDVGPLLRTGLLVATVLGLANITYRPKGIFVAYIAGTLLLPSLLKSFLAGVPLLAASGMSQLVCLFIIVALHFALQNMNDAPDR